MDIITISACNWYEIPVIPMSNDDDELPSGEEALEVARKIYNRLAEGDYLHPEMSYEDLPALLRRAELPGQYHLLDETRFEGNDERARLYIENTLYPFACLCAAVNLHQALYTEIDGMHMTPAQINASQDIQYRQREIAGYYNRAFPSEQKVYPGLKEVLDKLYGLFNTSPISKLRTSYGATAPSVRNLKDFMDGIGLTASDIGQLEGLLIGASAERAVTGQVVAGIECQDTVTYHIILDRRTVIDRESIVPLRGELLKRLEAAEIEGAIVTTQFSKDDGGEHRITVTASALDAERLKQILASFQADMNRSGPAR